MKPAICLFSDSLAPSGVGEHMLTLAEFLRERFSLSFVCPPSPAGHRMLDRAGQLGLATLALEVRGEPEADERLADWLHHQRAQLLHCHAGVAWEGHAGVRAARAAAVPRVVRTEHLADLTSVFALAELPDLIYSPYHRNDRRLSDAELEALVARNRKEQCQLVGLLDRLICVSAAVRDSFVDSGVPVERTRVVRNGIQPRPPSPDAAAARQRLGLRGHTKIVLTIGRLIDVKGHHYLLSAVEQVLQQQPDVVFLWVGGGPLEEELLGRVQALGLEEAVRLLGQRNDVPDLMAAADLFVLPSLVEGLPLVVLEAMAAGLPVIGTRVSGTSEVICDGVTGRLVPRGALVEGGDAAELAAAIVEVLSDPELAARWGAAGRSLVASDFTAERMAGETADVYDDVLAEPTRGYRR